MKILSRVIVTIVLAIFTKCYLEGMFEYKDGTAQGVAKVRHYESLHKPSKRLYYDPYACHMYKGSFVQTWLGEKATKRLYDLSMKGVMELLTIRTKWYDDQIMEAIQDKNATQMIILGAGYDTRGFRLELPEGFSVIEVDQPTVQGFKKKKLENISGQYEHVASRLDSGMVQFLSVDFNTDSIEKKLTEINSPFNRNKPTIVILEGVTQYIPKSSTSSTLTQIHGILPKDSILLISYVPQDLFDNPEKCGPPKSLRSLLRAAKTVGEPWISGFSPQEFKSFLDNLGYEVVLDSTVEELSDKYLAPLNRSLDKNEILSVERYVLATVKGD